MPDLSKVYVSEETLDLATGVGQFTTTFACDITKVSVSGVAGTATQAVLNVDGVDVATITLNAGAGEADTTAGVEAASAAAASNVTAQTLRANNNGQNPLGVVKQANATNVGSANFIGPEVANPTPVANNVAAGKVVKVTATGATAGTAVVTLDKAGAAVGVNPNTATDSTY